MLDNIQDAEVVNETAKPPIEAINFKDFTLEFLKQYSNIGQLTWTFPEPDQIENKLEINIVRVLDAGIKQRFRITIENPDELKF